MFYYRWVPTYFMTMSSGITSLALRQDTLLHVPLKQLWACGQMIYHIDLVWTIIVKKQTNKQKTTKNNNKNKKQKNKYIYGSYLLGYSVFKFIDSFRLVNLYVKANGDLSIVASCFPNRLFWIRYVITGDHMLYRFLIKFAVIIDWDGCAYLPVK